MEMFSYDHDLEEFVTIGWGTVSEDGSILRSNPGVGVVKAGWHCGAAPSGAGAAGECGWCNKCNGEQCVGDSGNVPADGEAGSTIGDCQQPACECAGQNCSLVSSPDDGDFPRESTNPNAACLTCRNGKIEPAPDDGTQPPPPPLTIPAPQLVNAPAGAEWGETAVNGGISYGCVDVCKGGQRGFELQGGWSGSFTIRVWTQVQAPSCSLENRRQTNVNRTVTHENKHASFYVSLINQYLSPIGTLYPDQQSCENARQQLASGFQADVQAMAARQRAHTDFRGEAKYGARCNNGTSEEVRNGTY
jgi:hypothetical protein